MTNFPRIFKFAWQSIGRNAWVSVATLAVIVLTLLVINVSLGVKVISQAAVSALREQVAIDLYFTADASENTQKAMRGYLQSLPEVRDVVVIGAAEALENFKLENAANPDIVAALEEVGENPIGNSLRVRVRDPRDVPVVIAAAEAPEFSPYIKDKGYDDVQYFVERLGRITSNIEKSALVLALFLGVIALLLVYNAIRLSVFVRRDEIGVMKLVGAKDSFIRGPFILEAIIYSFVATVIVVGLCWAIVPAVDPYIQNFFGSSAVNLKTILASNGPFLFFSQFMILAIFCSAVSILALKRHVR